MRGLWHATAMYGTHRICKEKTFNQTLLRHAARIAKSEIIITGRENMCDKKELPWEQS